MRKNYLKQIVRVFALTGIFSIILFSSVFSQSSNWNKKQAEDKAELIEGNFNGKQNQTSFSADGSLDDFLIFAAKNNPGLMAAFNNWKAALEKTGYAGALPDPMFGFGYFVESAETRVGPQNKKLSFKQSFPWFGTLGDKKDKAFEMSNALYQKFQSEKFKLFYTLKSAYYDYYFLAREIEITSDNMALLTFWEAVARTKYKVALKSYPDVIKAQVELGKLEDRLLTLEDKKRPIHARLLSALNLSDSIVIPAPNSIALFEYPVAGDSLIDEIKRNNPNLEAMRHLIEKANISVSLAKKASYPNFTFGIDYIETGEALNPLMDESGKDPLIVSAGINLPIWFGKNKAKRNEAKALKRAAQYRLQDSENMLTAFAEKVIFEHDDALRKLQLYRDGLLPKAEQSLNASYTAYQAGEMDFLNVLDAQRQLINFQLSLDKARTNVAKKKAEIEMLAGKELKIDDNQ